MSRKMISTEEWIESVKLNHDDRYVYDRVVYVGQNKKVIIGCKKHGYFEMLADSFKGGGNCPLCNKKSKHNDKKLFIEEARKIHGNKYDYSKVDFSNGNKEILIVCPIHGEFKQNESLHLRGCGCMKCAKDSRRNCNKDKKKLTEDFIRKAIEIHKDKYDYSKVEYVDAKTQVLIICKEHGEFKQTPSDHLQGKGCKLCGKKIIVENVSFTHNEFIEKAREVHGDKYEYCEYKGMRNDIEIICPIHGMFKQKPMNHIYKGQGCPECGKLKCIESNTMTTEQFIKRCKEVHGDLYDYTETVYNGWLKPFKYICHKKHGNGVEHGVVEQMPSVHLLLKSGCPKCKMSHLENDMIVFLQTNGIKYEFQKKFEWLGRLRLDFYLPEYNVAIECQGEQHFKEVKYFGGKEKFELTRKCDNEKKRLCIENNIRVFYYTYMKDFVDISNNIFKDKESMFEYITRKW